ncbi:MAG TPA: choice-of-anchor P family protein [Acidimicrobiales bacterium]|nr:choice-of-anchor P family protein [Acidimicrobiales bacterium]
MTRTVVRVAAAAAVGLVALLAGGPARAGSPAPPALGGYNVSADGNAVDILVDNATGLAGVHPLSEADFPEAESTFETGPFGSGLATVFWPGGPAADFSALAPEVGFPPSSEPLYSKLYDPVRASAEYPAGPDSSSYPPGGPPDAFVMHAQAGPTGVTSTAALVDQQSTASILAFTEAKGTSSADATTQAVATSSSALAGVKLLGGLIDIGSITSTAKASSDGSDPPTGSAATHISGVTVLGQPASIGSDGLTLPDFASSLGPVVGPIVQNAISQTISGLGLTVTEFPSTVGADGEAYDATSGGVSIRIVPPSSAAPLLEQAGEQLAPFFPAQAAIVPTLPGILQGMTMTITLGRATASSDASPPFSFAFNPSGTPAAGSGGTTGTAASAPSSAPPAGGGASPGVSLPVAAGASTPLATSTGTAGGVGPAVLVSFSPLGATAVALGVAVAALVGYALFRFARLALARDATSACPIAQQEGP